MEHGGNLDVDERPAPGIRPLFHDQLASNARVILPVVAERQTSNLRVGGSNPSERAPKTSLISATSEERSDNAIVSSALHSLPGKTLHFRALSSVTGNYMQRRRNASSQSVLVDEPRRDLRHSRGVGFTRLEQVAVAVEGHGHRRMTHQGLDPLRAEACLDPQGGTGMAQRMQ
jgi:hypothetical protein